MHTIGQLVKRYSLSRSTLLYYDSIGLLQPSGRSDANYRLYSDSDLKRMDKISLFRSAGMSLESISALLDREGDGIQFALEQRLFSINSEIQKLRNQQQVILNILQDESATRRSRVVTKDAWVALLQAAGLDQAGMQNWHIEFERMSPEAHQDFLESIGIEKDEIASIRKWSKAGCS
jgi:MerR family transcriptional regulator, thiopeptide resistance regulator